MSYHHGYSICVSSQIGCKMGCKFCASTGINFIRSLTSGEIVEQISACSNGSREEALKDTYFIGYYLQRNALYTSQNNKENHEEEEV